MPTERLTIPLFISFLITFAFSQQYYYANVPQEQYFTSKSTNPEQYALFITAQSVFESNFFRFSSIQTQFPSLITVIDLTPTNLDVSFTYQNLLTQQQAIDSGVNIAACVTETTLDCTTDPSSQICQLLVPTPSQDGIMEIYLADVDCRGGGSYSLCQLSLNNTSLTDSLGQDFFVSSDILCPDASITVKVIVSILVATIDAPYIADQGDITFHYHTVTAEDSDFWMMTGSVDRFGDSSEVSTNSVEPLVVLDDSNSTEVDYATIIKTRLMRHNHTVDLYCRYELTYTGIIRGIFINDYPSGVHAPSGIGLETETQVVSSIRLPIWANHLNYVNIFGYNMTKTDLQFIDCQEGWNEDADPSVYVEFSTYSYGEQVADSQDYTIAGLTYGCSGDCLRCSARGNCIECSTHLYKARCEPYCLGNLPISDYKGICNSFFQSGAVLLEAYDESADQTNIIFYSDFENPNPYALVLNSMSDILSGPNPLIWLSGTTLFAESVVTLIPSLQYGLNSIPTSVSTPNSSVMVFLPSHTTLNPGQVTAMYYPLSTSSSLVGFTWDLDGQAPTLQIDKVNPDESPTVANGGYVFADPEEYLIFQGVLNCISACKISVKSDGRVQLFKNDETLLFDVRFITLWTYTYPDVVGFMSIKFVITGASYFQPTITGGQLYSSDNMFFYHNFNLSNSTTPATTVPNCLNSQEDVCLSCQETYYLAPDNSYCSQYCSELDYPSIMDRACKPACSTYELLNTAGFKCQPKCEQLGYYFKTGQGCILCVPECATCATDGTCVSCRFPDPNDSSTYCARKTGTLYTQTDFSTSQTISFQINQGVQLAVIVADQGITSNSLFYYDNLPRKVPRVMKAMKMETSGGSPNTASLTLPPVLIPESGTITVHYVTIIQDISLTDFSIGAFRQKGFMEWPSTETLVPQVDTCIATFEYGADTAIPLTVYEYETIIGTRLYKHDQPDQLKCTLQVSFMGNLRGLYTNGDLLLTGNTADERTEATFLTRQFIFEADELLVMSFVGYRLTVTGVNFLSCVNEGGTLVAPVLDSYLISGFDAHSDDFSVTSNTYCGPNCIRCVDNTRCLRCDTDLYLLDGVCESECPAGQYRLLFGYCSSEIQNQGFYYYSGFPDYPNVLKVQYILPLQVVGMQVLVIAHPFQVYPTPHVAYAFIPDATPAFTEGVYLVQTYVQDEIMLVSQFPIKSEAVSDSQNNDFLIYTIRPDVALFYYYSQLPTTIPELLAAEDFEYVSSPTGQPILVQESNINYLDFFINCADSCSISFELIGNVQILLNERTILFEGYVESFVGSITLSRTLSGLNHLVIQFWSTTSFTLDIQGTYNIFALGDFIAQKHLDDTVVQPCTAPNCLNCYQDQCFSCLDGYFLDPSTSQCVQTCPGSTMGDLFERVCKDTDCSSLLSDSLLVTRDGACIWNCIDNPGFYYDISTGCTDPCSNACQTCSGPLSTQCLVCSLPAETTNTGACICPGNVDSTTEICSLASQISLEIGSFALTCDTIQLTATFLQEAFLNAVFYWESASSDSSPTSITSIQNFLSTQQNSVVNLPKEFLEDNKSYTFTVYYFDNLNNVIQDSKVLETVYNVLPDLTIVGGTSQTKRAYMSNTLQVAPTDLVCITAKLTATWQVLSGSISTSDLLFFPVYPLQAVIRSCTIPFNTSVTLKATVWNVENPSLTTDLTVQVSVRPEMFRALVITNNQDHPENVDLQLNGTIEYYDHCRTRQQGDIYYWWSCSNVTQGQPCQDNSGLFNVRRSTGELIIPEDTFDDGQTLVFKLFVEKNGVIRNATLNINITPPNTFIIDASIEPRCQKYATNKDCIVTAKIKSNQTILTRWDYQTLAFNWQTTPLVPFAYFQDIMKLFSSQNQLPANTRSLLIEFSVMNATHNGLSYLSLPINYPPSGGNFTVTPSVGVSLSTYFTISANGWQDEDIPIAYQYYYSFVQDDDLAPILYPYSTLTNIVSILPSQYTGAPVFLRVDVQDFLGAISIAETQVQVNPNTLTIQQQIQEYNNLLDSIGESGSLPSGIIVSTVSKAISQLEEELSDNVSDPVCPTCSSHGTCPVDSSRCTCNIGWDLADCSVQESIVDEIIGLKEKYLNDLVASYNNALNDSQSNPAEYQDVYQLQQENYQQAMLQVLNDAAKNPYFNTNSSLTLVEQILAQTMDILNSNTTLTVPDQVETLSEILSSMLTFAATQDCAGVTQFTEDLKEITTEYLEKIAECVLSQKITQENATIITTDNIDMYFQKLSLCDLQNKTLCFGRSNTPTITINLDPNVTLNCSAEYDLQYYAFNDDLLNCSKNPDENPSKTIVGINISDATTGTTINVSLTVTIQPAPECPSVCVRLENGACQCSSISPFDVKKQIILMFELSNALKLLQIDALLEFQFWKSISFWGVTVFTMVFIANLFIVKKMATFNRITLIKQIPPKTKTQIFWNALLITHPLMSIHNTIELHFSKRSRAILFFTRNMLLLTLTSTFSEPSETPTVISITESDFFLFLMPFFSVIPICFLIAWMIKTPPIKNEPKRNEKFDLARAFMRIRARLGYIAIAILFTGCLLLIFIIDANENNNERLSWTVEFIKSILQDFFLTPLIDLLFQYCAWKAYEHKYVKKRPKLKKLVFWTLEESLVELAESLSSKRVRALSRQISTSQNICVSQKSATFNVSDDNFVICTETSPEKTACKSSDSPILQQRKSSIKIIKPPTIQELSVEDSVYRVRPEATITQKNEKPEQKKSAAAADSEKVTPRRISSRVFPVKSGYRTSNKKESINLETPSLEEIKLDSKKDKKATLKLNIPDFLSPKCQDVASTELLDSPNSKLSSLTAFSLKRRSIRTKTSLMEISPRVIKLQVQTPSIASIDDSNLLTPNDKLKQPGYARLKSGTSSKNSSNSSRKDSNELKVLQTDTQEDEIKSEGLPKPPKKYSFYKDLNKPNIEPPQEEKNKNYDNSKPTQDKSNKEFKRNNNGQKKNLTAVPSKVSRLKKATIVPIIRIDKCPTKEGGNLCGSPNSDNILDSERFPIKDSLNKEVNLS